MFNLRRSFLLDPSIVFLNHGSFGATPRPVFRAYQNWQRQLENQPVEFLGRRFRDLMTKSRVVLGDYLGTCGNNLVYTTNVTEALNIVARSLDLGSGDEVLSTNHEYGALDRTWRFISKERGFKYITQNIPTPFVPSNFMEDVWEGVTSRTRVIFLSHITSPTALLFPVETIVSRARNEGIISVIDGAHAPGQIPLRLDDLGADFYCGNLHKWLCAPKGAGFLFARESVQHLLKPLIVSWGYEPEDPGVSQFIDHHEWKGTRDIAAFLSVPIAIEFQKQHSWDKVRCACNKLINELDNEIFMLTRLPTLSSELSRLQMISMHLPDSTDLEVLQTQLYQRYRIEVPLLLWNGMALIRVSIQGYNNKKDVKKLFVALQNLGVWQQD